MEVVVMSLATHLWELLFSKDESRCSRRARFVKPRLEVLEDRIQLSTFEWIGQYSALASNPANWWINGVEATLAVGAGDTVDFQENRNSLGLLMAFNSCTIDAGFTGTVANFT
jgi:hypothetical protein